MSFIRPLRFLATHTRKLKGGQPTIFGSALAFLFACFLLVEGCASTNDTQYDSAITNGITNLEGVSADPLRIARHQPVVLIFVRTDCPVSNRYAPEIERLYQAFSAQGIAFWLVYPDADPTAVAIKDHLREYRLDVPALRDPKHALVRASGVSVTPETVVLLPSSSQPIYRGRIDDRMADFGKERPEAREHDLENVLQKIVAGKKVTARTTKAIGCYISEK